MGYLLRKFNEVAQKGGKNKMIFEVLTTAVMGGIAIHANLQKNGVGNDSKKINRIFALSGLNVKDGKQTYTTQLIKKRNYEWGTEYRYRIPLGRSFEDYLAKQKTIESGINSRRVKIQFKDLSELKLDRNIIQSIKGIYSKKLTERKEIELFYDGLLKIRVYNEPMPTKVDFTTDKNWRIPFGISRMKNEMIYHDFDKIPHLALGGATRYGKSNLINCIINALIRQQPNNVKLHLIDLKGGIELSDYEYLQQTVSIAYEPEDALKTLENAYNMMKQKQVVLKRAGKKKVEDAGITERHFVIIDEVGELNPDEAIDKEEKDLKKQCQKYMSQIARLGAGLGFRQILATQYPTGDVIPRQCKQNSDAKLCFRVQSGTASRVVLDGEGAETLPEIKGRAIYQTADKKIIIQTPLITENIIQETINPYIVEKKEVNPIVERETREDTVKFEKTRFS
jgi:DNA segregation ATPase FtsK/SpoIIIE, S-DNA-T family